MEVVYDAALDEEPSLDAKAEVPDVESGVEEPVNEINDVEVVVELR